MIVRLVPNTGIQYQKLDPIKEADVSDCPALVFRSDGSKCREMRDPNASMRREDEEDDYYGSDEDPEALEREGRRSISATSAELLAMVARMPGGLWLPIPFDRGRVWAALHLESGSEGYQAALAVDTTMETDGNPEGLDNEELGIAQPSPFHRRFWRSSVLQGAVRAIARLVPTDDGRSRSLDDVELAIQKGIVALAFHLQATVGLKVQFAPRPEFATDVTVDMVVDLGNSRTCVLLLEDASRVGERLELVYPDDPHKCEACPFDSQFAFVEHKILPLEGDPPDDGAPFRFLSQIVFGERGGNLLRTVQCNPQTVGMTSPKRYLWEQDEQVRWTWRLANDIDEGSGENRTLRGDILRHMSSAEPLKDSSDRRLPSQPNHPRLACAVWAIVELLEQAFRQINSPQWRRAEQFGPRAGQRRRIANIVLMYPAGMHSEEIKRYRDAADRAGKLWSAFRTSPADFSGGKAVGPDPQFGVRAPRIHVVCDEALAIQSCWIYGELVYRHGGQVEQFLRVRGRAPADREKGAPNGEKGAPNGEKEAPNGEKEAPNGEKGTPKLRVASLDVGGGTIDLAIADYEKDPDLQNAIGLTCKRLFHDGISRAGDEVVRTLLQEVIFVQIAKHLGVSAQAWSAFFRSDLPAHVKLRRQLVRNVWMPLAKDCLEGIERHGKFEKQVSEIEGVDDGKLTEFTEALASFDRQPPEGARIGDTRLSVDAGAFRKVARTAIGRTIRNCCDIVSQFDCDVLIVGGRPTSNPQIRQQIEQGMAVPPGQVVFLSDWRVGDWYPFVEGNQRVGDAKTCGVVGASIVFRALYGHGRFRLAAKPMDGPQPIFGVPLHDRVAAAANAPLDFSDAARLNFDEKRHCRLKVPIQMGTGDGVVLAMRRIASEEAEAAPAYMLRLKGRYREHLQANPVTQDQVEVQVSLSEAAVKPCAEKGKEFSMPLGAVPDVLRKESLVGDVHLPGQKPVSAEEALELVLRTMLDGDGYWIDTGRFGELQLDEAVDMVSGERT